MFTDIIFYFLGLTYALEIFVPSYFRSLTRSVVVRHTDFY